MDEEKNSGVMSVVLVVLLIGAIGVGGYFTGKIIDTNAMEADQVDQDYVAISDTYSDENLDFDIHYTYPKEWEISESENAVVFISPNGSTFRYVKYEGEEESLRDCGSNCIVVGEYKRELRSETEVDGVVMQEWFIFEDVAGEFIHDENDGFSYVLAEGDTIGDLDNIMTESGRL